MLGSPREFKYVFNSPTLAILVLSFPNNAFTTFLFDRIFASTVFEVIILPGIWSNLFAHEIISFTGFDDSNDQSTFATLFSVGTP